MGAWGERTFEDDTAMDLLDEWMDEDNPEDVMEEAVRQALGMDYLEYSEGQAVAVASAVLDLVLNDQAVDELGDEQEFDVWARALSRTRLDGMRLQVAQALAKLLSQESELRELWEENQELYPKWRQILEDRRARLLVE